MARFTSWLNPSADPQGTGFQLIHGMQALGSGGILGQGLGGSREKWGTLPEAHTDFIYAVIGEELGLFGTVTILLLFAAIAFIGLRIAKKSDDLFIELASFGIVTWLIWQMMVNIGAVLRIMPITGVPLPLVSYGGSSLIPTLAALGLLMSFALHEAKK
jgi:cell division protein FtsW